MSPFKIVLYFYSFLFLCGILVGCGTKAVYTLTTYDKGEVTSKEKLTITPPKDAKSGSSFSWVPDGNKTLTLSGAQSRSKLAKAKGEAKGMLILYSVAGLICVAGAIMLGWRKFSNKEAMEVFGIGIGMGVVLYLLPSTIVWMQWLLPVVLVLVLIYIAYFHIKTKKGEELFSL